MHRSVLVAEHRQALVNAPADRTVVDYPVLLVETTEAVPSVGTVDGDVLVAEAEAHEAHNDVVPFDGAWIVGYADSVAGC